MAECSKCGKQSMSFTCRYCGEKFCSEHRLPEKHDCDGLESGKKEEYSSSSSSEEKGDDKWFDEKFSNKKKTQKEFVKPSMFNEAKRILKNNITLAIIGLTVFSYALQFIVPGYFEAMVLNPGISEVLSSPWTVFTVMLLHSNGIHLAANMITFYFFGTAVEKAVGGRKLVEMYLISGLVASFGYIGFRNLLNLMYGAEALGPAVGASGAVVAMVGITAMLYPTAEVLLYFIIPMKIKTAVYLFAGIEGINLIAKALNYQLPIIGLFASSAHLAGLAIGLYYGKKLQNKYSQRTSLLGPNY
jgi:membrane associated rhomboid family serine protease